MRIETIDLKFQGAAHVIASFLIHGPQGPVLIEPGPGSTLTTLTAELDRRGLAPSDIRDVLVTHIHLDHAGSAGWWAEQGARIHVHPAGAPHLIDPGKLLASATRIYGDRMDQLWGQILPAPADRVAPVEDGSVLEIAGLEVRVIETPGHARHHHVFQIDEIVFTGDAAGILLPDNRWVDLPAPPPEFDLEAWKVSLDRLRSSGARTFYRTHFGPSENFAAELDRLEEVLDRATGWIREMLDEGRERAEMVELFGRRMREWATSSGTNAIDARAYELANPREMTIDGIARYWQKKAR